MEKEVLIYRTPSGKEPFLVWLYSLRDKECRYRIEARINRIEQGNYGDHKRFHGILEIRLDFGKGYRLYCGEDGLRLVVLLLGGVKAGQEQDIRQALAYWRDYHERKKDEDIH